MLYTRGEPAASVSSSRNKMSVSVHESGMSLDCVVHESDGKLLDVLDPHQNGSK